MLKREFRPTSERAGFYEPELVCGVSVDGSTFVARLPERSLCITLSLNAADTVLDYGFAPRLLISRTGKRSSSGLSHFSLKVSCTPNILNGTRPRIL